MFENSRSQIVFRTDILPKIVVGCPCSYWRTSSACRGIKNHVNTKFKKYFRETFQYDFPSHEIPHAQVNHLQFLLGRALALVVLHPRQNGGVNLERVYLHDSISLLRWKMFPKQSLKGRFLPWKILPKAHYLPQFSTCSPVMDAIVADDTFRSDKASQLQTSPNRHFVCCYTSRDASRDIN